MSEFVRVATVGDLADGEIMLVTADGEEVVLVRVVDGYHAIAPVCSHAFGPLELGTIHGHEIECPIHRGRFDLRSGPRASLPRSRSPRTRYGWKGTPSW